MKLSDGGAKPATYLKKRPRLKWKFKNFSRTALLQKQQLWTTASGYIKTVTVKLKCHKVSVAELIMSKSYKEAEHRCAARGGGGGRV